MRISKLILLLLFIGNAAFGQIFNPVEWSHKAKDLGDGKYELIFDAKIDDGWHLYSQTLPDVFPRPEPTTFYWDTLTAVELVGETEEGESESEYDPNFEMQLNYFSHKARFTQQVQVTADKGQIIGAVQFMVCDDSKCLPPEYYEFTIDLEGSKTSGAVGDPGNNIQAKIDKGAEEADKGLWTIFILGFGGGLLALLMPCIFPMIPLTVSFFTKQSKSRAEGIRKAIIYGVSIVAIYVALGMLVTLITGDSSALNAMSTNPWFNLAFFVLFVVFAISFFGAFEITLPSKWVNKADEAAGKKGLIGIFFMAFTLSLVSFSCTGPIIGSLLVDAASKGDYLGPVMGMLGFSLALAIPFTLFAIFPGMMNSLPSSGGWLNTVKVSLGFLELAFAFKFLSTADLVWQMGWLQRELFIAIWVAIAFALALYLFGAFRMKSDSEVQGLSVTRMLFGLFFTIFGFYLLPGMWGAPVKLVSGFPPPAFYAEAPGGFGGGSGGSSHGSAGNEETAGNHCPVGIPCYNDYEEALAAAKEQDKPIFIDFTGFGCVNCRKMEERVWDDGRVHGMLTNDFILLSLYVDDRTKLKAEDQVKSELTGNTLRTIGNKWSEFQAVNFSANSQPYYVILGTENLEPLVAPRAFDLDTEAYVTWLESGLEAYEAQ